jgi:hypothetical protein
MMVIEVDAAGVFEKWFIRHRPGISFDKWFPVFIFARSQNTLTVPAVLRPRTCSFSSQTNKTSKTLKRYTVRG